MTLTWVYITGLFVCWILFTPFVIKEMVGEPDNATDIALSFVVAAILASIWPVILLSFIIGAIIYVPSMLIYGFLFVRPKERREGRELEQRTGVHGSRYSTGPRGKPLTTFETIDLLSAAKNEEELEKIKAEIHKRGIE